MNFTLLNAIQAQKSWEIASRLRSLRDVYTRYKCRLQLTTVLIISFSSISLISQKIKWQYDIRGKIALEASNLDGGPSMWLRSIYLTNRYSGSRNYHCATTDASLVPAYISAPSRDATWVQSFMLCVHWYGYSICVIYVLRLDLRKENINQR